MYAPRAHRHLTILPFSTWGRLLDGQNTDGDYEPLFYELEGGGIVGVDWVVMCAQAFVGALVANWDLLGDPSRCVYMKKLRVVLLLR